MDEQKYLILDTRQGFRDLTGTVKSVNPRGKFVDISFYGDERVFSYSSSNISLQNDPKIIENDVAIKGCVNLNVEKKVLFGNFLKIFYHNSPESDLHRGDFEILKPHVSEILNYLCETAKTVKTLPSEKDGSPANTLIAEALTKIQKVPLRSPLYAYLSGTLRKGTPRLRNFIFPFPCNESQLNAVEQTFSNSLSLIQGPPGTGKTQTILNILLNAVIAGQKVAVVSNNNSAIRNVVEKLSRTDGLDFITALLGNKENQDYFLNHQPEYPSWLKEDIDFSRQEEEELHVLHRELKTLFEVQNRLKKKQSEFQKWKTEAKKFIQHYPDIPQFSCDLHSEELLQLFIRCNMRYIRGKKLSVWFRLWQTVFRHNLNFAFWKQPLTKILNTLKSLYYRKKCRELQAEIKELEKQLADIDFEKKHETLNALSRKFLKVMLRKKYPNFNTARKKCCKADLKNGNFLSEYPVVLSTTFMINRFTPEDGFDLLIMDEASQVDLCTGVAAIACAKNAVIVGDEKQLPCVITTEDENKLSELNSSSRIPEVYQYHAGQSILSSLRKALPEIPNTTLCEHYRCDPLIIGFCNQKFYHNELIIHSPWKSGSSPMNVLFTASGNHARGHFNLRQCQEVNLLVDELTRKENYPPDSIGLCTPYREQAQILGGDTVHKFQGREKEVMILSTVDNQISNFTADEQLLNVAVSRAIKKFYIVLSSSNRQWDNCIGDLINYIRYHNSDAVSAGHITSVFDMLYDEYCKYLNTPEYRDFFFDSPAEKIIYDVLTDILQKHDKDCRYSFQMHIPLQEIFGNNPQFSREELAYLNNNNTHVDFLIYEKFGKTPCSAIEVDGYTFHKSGTRQAKRDQLKNSIFAKSKLPLLRLVTNDSNEYEKITAFLFGK